MTAPSNANTSGLEVVAWRWRFRTDGVWNYQEAQQRIPDVTCEPLVTAASAQAAIDAAEARADRLARVVKSAQSFIADGGLAEMYPGSAIYAELTAALQQETQP